MASIAINAFQRDSMVFREDKKVDFAPAWERLESPYERTYMQTWVTVHVNGLPIFATAVVRNDEMAKVHETIDLVERASKGVDLTESMLRDVVSVVAPSLTVVHDSQTAVVLTSGAGYEKCAILDRTGGAKRSLSFTVMTDKTPITVPAMLLTAADLIEATNISDMLNRVNRGQGKPLQPADVGIPNDRFIAGQTRRRQLLDVLRGFEKAYQVRYRPERPAFLAPTPPAAAPVAKK
ncbi:MAG: hypothetical protein H7840_14240 [Alphaproteobacteria bacterium]